MAMQLDRLIESRRVKPAEPLPVPLNEVCERYERLYSGAVSDVLREMNYLYQALPNDIVPLRDEMVVAGEAFTVKGAATLEIKDDMRIRGQMLDAIGRESVIVWDTTRDNSSAHLGEVMAMTARRQGCRGAIVDGGIRDTRLVLAQQFPVWYRYRSSSAMMGRFRITGWNIPIEIGRVHIFPGDFVFADIDGALVVPREVTYAVLQRAEQVVHGEQEIKQWVEDGVPVQEVIDRGGYF